jgi:hypothetical protein
MTNRLATQRALSSGGASAPAVANLTTFGDGKIVEIVHYPNAGEICAG